MPWNWWILLEERYVWDFMKEVCGTVCVVCQSIFGNNLCFFFGMTLLSLNDWYLFWFQNIIVSSRAEKVRCMYVCECVADSLLCFPLGFWHEGNSWCCEFVSLLWAIPSFHLPPQCSHSNACNSVVLHKIVGSLTCDIQVSFIWS